MDRINQKVDSKFRFVLLAATRAEQLIRGARPRLVGSSPKVSRIAMEELLEDLLVWDYGPAPDPAAEEPKSATGSPARETN